MDGHGQGRQQLWFRLRRLASISGGLLPSQQFRIHLNRPGIRLNSHGLVLVALRLQLQCQEAETKARACHPTIPPCLLDSCSDNCTLSKPTNNTIFPSHGPVAHAQAQLRQIVSALAIADPFVPATPVSPDDEVNQPKLGLKGTIEHLLPSSKPIPFSFGQMALGDGIVILPD